MIEARQCLDKLSMPSHKKKIRLQRSNVEITCFFTTNTLFIEGANGAMLTRTSSVQVEKNVRTQFDSVLAHMLGGPRMSCLGAREGSQQGAA